MEFPPHVLKYAPWSISKAGVIERCSLRFDMKYGPAKVKEPDVEDDSARVGTAVHAALEYTLQGEIVRRAMEYAAQRGGLTSVEEEKLMGFKDQVARFTERMERMRVKFKVPDSAVYIERKWAFDTNFKKADYWDKHTLFRGSVDYGVLTGANDLIIIDHKSGKEKDIATYEPQLRSYCVMALANNPSIRGVQTAINFIQTDNLVWNKWVSADTIRDEYQPWLAEHLIASCKGLLAAPAASKGWWCEWCGYKPTCPAHTGDGRGSESAS